MKQKIENNSNDNKTIIKSFKELLLALLIYGTQDYRHGKNTFHLD